MYIFENPRSENERKKLKGKHPDYVLYSNKRDLSHPVAIIETKRKGKDLDSALEQGESYARQLNSPIVFATDGVFYKTIHMKCHKPLFLNNEEVDELIRETLALQYLDTHEVSTIPKEVQVSRSELIQIFGKANDDLRKVGLRAGIERFNEFANILFLKLLNDIENLKLQEGKNTTINESCKWDYFRNLTDSDTLLAHINGIVLPSLNSIYGENSVLPKTLAIRDGRVLRNIVDKLDPLVLTAINLDVKGDSFEHFLKATTATKNDLGEYFTPRHIVKTMGHLVNPKFGEKVYDPFCGTGGMLIQAFKHIQDSMSQKELEDEKKIKYLQHDSVYGNELTNTARIAKMNMILSGDGHSNITMKDSLNPDDRFVEHGSYDAVVSNIPYSQKTEYGSRYPIPTNNGDSICVQHCVDSLKEGGRMALVVPEGFMFRNDLKKTREWLFKNSDVHTVVSLPQGVFLPYTPVKTNILYCNNVHKPLNKKNVYFFTVKNDGYSLDNRRIKLTQEKSDIDIFERRCSLTHEEDLKEIGGFDIVSNGDIKTNNYNLAINQYKQTIKKSENVEFIKLEDLVDVECGKRITVKNDRGTLYPVYGGGGETFRTDKYNRENCLIISRFGMSENCVRFINDRFWLNDSGFSLIVKNKAVLESYLNIILENIQDEIYSCGRGAAQKNIDFDEFKSLVVPIPSTEEQQQIVNQLKEEKELIVANKKLIEIQEQKIKDKVLALFS